VREAGASLDEALALLATVAGEGPRYAAMLHGLQAERDGLRGHVPDTVPASRPAPPAEPLANVPRQAFLCAARDAGIADELPSTDASALLAIDRMRRAESDDPGRHGPAHGLLMAWRARLLVEIGKPDLARDLADRSVRQLSLYSDRPQHIQAPLVVALAVLQRAANACGLTEQADRAAQRATALYAILAARDATYTRDLAGTV